METPQNHLVEGLIIKCGGEIFLHVYRCETCKRRITERFTAGEMCDISLPLPKVCLPCIERPSYVA